MTEMKKRKKKSKLTGDGVRLAHQSILAASRCETIAWCIHHVHFPQKQSIVIQEQAVIGSIIACF